MNSPSRPLVSILTPVHNGEEYLSECIESVLAQTYSNWEYTIINNCSVDRTLEIAEQYAARDRRIRIQNNERFVPAIFNQNIALAGISPASKYVKMVFADDWLFPECITKMVDLAEKFPSIGLVCSYAIDGKQVLWDGLPYSRAVSSGREFCRWALLGGSYVLGTATSQLMRSDLVRECVPFYDVENLHADYEACFGLLQQCDFGFVHQVLSFSRPRLGSLNDRAAQFYSHMLGTITVLLRYGPSCLSETELSKRLQQRWSQYYYILAENVFRCRGNEFWQYHTERLSALGHPLSRYLLLRAIMAVVVERSLHPKETLRALLSYHHGGDVASPLSVDKASRFLRPAS